MTIKKIDLIGKRFGKLVVISSEGKNRWGNCKFLCKCDCGREKIIVSGSLRQKITRSCGCLNFNNFIGEKSRTHGFRSGKKRYKADSFYHRFIGIKMRCNNPVNPKYAIYGGRGIKCEWKTFEQFRDDMYSSYLDHVNKFGLKNTQIDRIDVNGNYCKENCRWVTILEQAGNKRKSSRRNLISVVI